MKSSRILGFVGILFALLLSACVDKEVRLTSEEMQLVDSLFVKERKVWSVQLEDSCSAFRALHFDFWVDSMERERLKEIEMLLDR